MAKKAVKKSTKKLAKKAAKKSAKKVVKKAAKKAAKKSAKKVTKKLTKKLAKKATKTVAKKATNKASKKAGKPAVKDAGKAMKPTSRSKATPVAKKATKKVVKKAAKKTAQQVAKKASKKAGTAAAVTTAQEPLSVPTPARVDPGAAAPLFTLRDQDGMEHTVGGAGPRASVLFFYPKDMTSGCTVEACAFRDLKAEFDAAGADVYGISIMDPKSKKKFAAKEALNYPLLADDRETNGSPDPEVAQRYGVWVQKSMYGRAYMGLERSTYLIAKDGTVAKRWDAVSVPGHADEVLAAVRSLG